MEPDKFCQICGRRMAWRKAWEDCWDEVQNCSAKCRKRGRREIDDQIEAALVALLRERGRKKLLCPSEVARGLFPEETWREKMEEVRMAARRLVACGQAEILQKDQVVDASTAKGAIRVRLAKNSASKGD